MAYTIDRSGSLGRFITLAPFCLRCQFTPTSSFHLGTYLGLQRARTAPLITFTSWHTAGVQFCFADGSVRTVRFGNSAWDEMSPFTNDWYLLQQLAGYKDGQAADISTLLD